MATRILIVEDEVITAMDLKRELAALNFDVVATTDNGRDAIALAESLTPDLVLMDIRIAGAIDGVVAASAIRGNANVPVIFLTAHSDKATLTRALAASPFGYILKPFHIREIEVSIELALYKHAKEAELRSLVQDLETAMSRVKLLTGLLPICASCKKIRDEAGDWQEVEQYVREHSDAEFSHGICPECWGRLYPHVPRADRPLGVPPPTGG